MIGRRRGAWTRRAKGREGERERGRRKLFARKRACTIQAGNVGEGGHARVVVELHHGNVVVLLVNRRSVAGVHDDSTDGRA